MVTYYCHAGGVADFSIWHLQASLASGEDVFGPLIRRFLLQNTHKVTVELLPDAKLGAEVEQDEKARLKVSSDSMLSKCGMPVGPLSVF